MTSMSSGDEKGKQAAGAISTDSTSSTCGDRIRPMSRSLPATSIIRQEKNPNIQVTDIIASKLEKSGLEPNTMLFEGRIHSHDLTILK